MADKLRKFRKDDYVDKRFGKDINVSTKEDAPLKKDMSAAETKSVAKAKPASGDTKPSSFGAAFAAARKNPEAMKAGKFTWNGKSFSTALASDKKVAPAPVRRAPATETKKAAAPASTIGGTKSAPITREAAFEATKSKLGSYGATPRLLSRDTKGSAPARVSRPPLEEIANQSKPLTAEQRRKLNEARMRSGMRSSGLAKGGKIDGIAVRGKTKAGRNK